MEYKVFGTMVFNVSMVVDASSEDEAEQLAMEQYAMQKNQRS